MTVKEIKQQLRRLRAEMKEAGIRRISCFNGGLSPQEYHYNSKLYILGVELEKATKAESVSA